MYFLGKYPSRNRFKLPIKVTDPEEVNSMLNDTLNHIERNYTTIRKLGQKIDDTLHKLKEYNNRNRI